MNSRLIRRSGEVCLDGLIAGIIAESCEPMVLGYSRPVLPKDAKDGADTTAFDGRSEMLPGSAADALAVGGSVYVVRLQ